MQIALNLGNKGFYRAWVRPGCAIVVAGLLVAHLTACAQKTSPSPQVGPGTPRIVSGMPERDAAAFDASEDQLMQVRWGVLERRGPKAVVPGDPTKKEQEQTTAIPATAPARREPAEPAYSIMPMPGPATATAPATGETADQPVAVPLPDRKIKIIWPLRSYGGTSVASARDQTTARRTVSIKDADLAPIVTVLTQHLGSDGSVSALPSENKLIITCDERQKDSVIQLLEELDVPQRQVQITAKIFEVSNDFDFQQGAQLIANRLGSDNSQEVISTFNTQRLLDSSSPGGEPFQGSVLGLMKAFESRGISIDASFQLLADAGLVRLVSSPRMTVAAGQTGYMLAGQELPIQSANVVNNILQTITTYKPVGVQLYITPQAVSSDRVKLHTISIVSSVSGFAPLPTLSGHNKPQTLINPIIDSREAETAVIVNDGDTLVISGLRMIKTTSRENKVPGLGDIPIIGLLFKNHRSQQQLTDLYFFVTPTILADASL